MIIICEKCSSKFNVPDSAIGENGRKVKCTNCAHTWHQMPEGVAAPEAAAKESKPVEASIATQPEENKKAEKPAKQEKAAVNDSDEASKEDKATLPHKMPRRFEAPKVPFYQKSVFYYGSSIAACVAFIVVLGLFTVLQRDRITHFFPDAQSLYDMAGLYDNSGIKLELVDCTISDIEASKSDDNTIEIEVEVSVLNTTDKTKTLSDIRFTVYDIERNYVGELIMPIKLHLESQKNTTVEGRLNRVPKNSFYVAVDLGNEIDIKILNPTKMHELG